MRFTKRILIISVTLLVLITIFILVSFLVSKITNKEPKEKEPVEIITEIPERNLLEVLEIKNIEYIKRENGLIDVVIQIKNSNTEHGAEEMNFILTFLNGDIAVQGVNGSSYILPGEEKYIVLTNISINSDFNDIEMNINAVTWRKLQDFISLNLDVFDIKLERLSSGNTFNSKLSAFIKNNSLFGLTDIKVIGLLVDDSGNLLAINRTSIQTVLEGEMREVEMFWQDSIDIENVANIVVRAYSNALKNDNFVNKYSFEDPSRLRKLDNKNSDNYFELPELFNRFEGWTSF